MGAPAGNQNAKTGTEWRDAIRRALARQCGADGKSFRKGLDKVADKLVRAAIESGDQWAIKEIGERFDGKPSQAVVGDDGGPVQMEAVVRFVRSAD